MMVIETKFENARTANDRYFLRKSLSQKVIDQVRSFENQLKEENEGNRDDAIEIELDDIRGMSRILLFGEIIHLVVAANKNITVDYVLAERKYPCEHRPLFNGYPCKQKGNLLFLDIGTHEEAQREIEIISNGIGIDGSMKIAQAIGTSRTTGKAIDRDAFKTMNNDQETHTITIEGSIIFTTVVICV